MHVPTLHRSDFHAIKRHLPFTGCRACVAGLRRHFAALIVCSITGIDISIASPCQRSPRNITSIFRDQAARDGLFERLRDAGVLMPEVDWMSVKRGTYATDGYYFRAMPMRRIYRRYGEIVEEEHRQRRRELAEVSGGAGDGFGFRDTRIGELDGLSEAGRRLVRARSNARCGGGADALSAVGDDRYVESINMIAYGVEAACLALAAKDRDHQARLDAWLAENARKASRLAAVPRNWVAAGKRWTIHGVDARFIGTGDDEQLDVGGEQFDVRDLDAIPMDRATMKLLRTLPRMSEPVPF